MIETIYLESCLKDDPRALSVIEKITPKRIIFCDHYAEIFNRKRQNFYMQKQKPSLILAQKKAPFLHQTPHRKKNKRSYYFSLLYNCPFQCSYCFLQGFYRSAHYLYFVNHQDFFQAIDSIEEGYFYASHDSDSLALDRHFGLIHILMDYFQQHPQKTLELRTKSSYIFPFRQKEPLSNIVIAYSLNPQEVIQKYEKGTASLSDRLSSLSTLQKLGWNISLCFDPLIAHKDWRENYHHLFEEVFAHIDPHKIDSITIGSMRFPTSFFKNILKKRKEITLFTFLEEENGIYRDPEENLLIDHAFQSLSQYVSQEIIEIHRGCG